MKHFCQQASRLASDAIERKLTWGESARLKMHLALCGSCRNHIHDVRVIQSVLQTLRSNIEADTSITLPEKERQRIRLALQQIAEE